jgi:hypothetical protein
MLTRGHALDPASLNPAGRLAALDPAKLTRHAVCVGMTGSGLVSFVPFVPFVPSWSALLPDLPTQALRAHQPAEYVTGAVSALLSLVGLAGDPLTDPRAILLARVLGDAFARGEAAPFDVLLPRLVDPPFETLGYFSVDEVLPREERTALALALAHLDDRQRSFFVTMAWTRRLPGTGALRALVPRTRPPRPWTTWRRWGGSSATIRATTAR